MKTARPHVRRVLGGTTKMKQDNRRAPNALLAPRNRKRTATPVKFVHLVGMCLTLMMVMRTAIRAIKATSQPLEGTPFAQAVLGGLTKTKLASLTALPASPEAMKYQ